MRTLNLGILAHVDAGKTTLTERLLFAAGVIDAVGSVDHGNTHTDTLALERERGITIKSAVVSFVIDDITVNLIDTPGHPDFIAEVDRVLSLLDGAVLVVSAVEGVQAQTRILMRALKRLGVPTLIFMNKIDRVGADEVRVLNAIRQNLSPAAVAMATTGRLGTREATVVPFGRDDATFLDDIATAVADHDDQFLERYVVDDQDVDYDELRLRLASWSKRAMVHPVFPGSAITGAGVEALMAGIAELLPALDRAVDDPVSGVVFKIERSSTGERAAVVVRMYSGAIRTRERVVVRGKPRRITKISVYEGGGATVSDVVTGGQIARITGLGAVRIGDAIGESPARHGNHFAPPPFEAVVTPTNDSDRGALHSALEALADEDPLINLRQDESRGEMSVSLYGEVQREVIRDTLDRDFGIKVEFSDTTTVYIERLAGIGEGVEPMPTGRTSRTPFLAGVGLRIEPAAPETGVTFSTGIETGRLPMAFINAVEEAVRETVRHGLHGWDIPDCVVTMTSSGYWPRQSRAHGTFDKNMSSTASDFRHLTPLVLMRAIRAAGTIVHEPVDCFYLEAPADALGAIARVLASLHATPESPTQIGSSFILRGLIPAAGIHELRQHLPGLTSGEGFVESKFSSYRPVLGPAPRRSSPDRRVDNLR
jgi:ribosomal protection tetracycline resistance protein